MLDYVSELNDAQRTAVLHTNGALLVLAGAGAGKTKVITHRILHLLHQGIAPEHILAITFTNKAAKEMRERVVRLIRADQSLNIPLSYASMPRISTFHSLGVALLRARAGEAGLAKRFSIFDRNDSVRAIKRAMKDAGIDPKQYEPRKILGSISRKKGAGVSLAAFREDAGNEYYPRIVLAAWERYEKTLREEGALDFDDLLLRSVQLLSSNSAVLESCRKQWSHLHIDEYQDTNHIQYELAKLLAGKNPNICAVGDIDQTIYSWRGADLSNLLAFEKTYPRTTVVMLEENYRSTKTILDAANAIIQKNVNRVPKNLFTQNNKGEKITIAGLRDEMEEARFVATRAGELIESGGKAKDIAVLYRANFQSRALEEAFLSAGLPYQVLGVRFFERKEVKDVLSFIRAALHPERVSDLARIVNVPPRGIGKVTLLKMIEGKEHSMTPAARKNVADFKVLLARVRDTALTKTPSATVKCVLRETGLEELLINGSDDDQERLENIKELATLAARYDELPPEEGIDKLLEDAALASDQDELRDEQDAVRLMTVHASKGLEFEHVFITGLEAGLFPHAGFDEDRDDEEERRLFYVALTRAGKKVFLSFAAARTIFGSRDVTIPSEFITDIDERLLEPFDAGEDVERIIL